MIELLEPITHIYHAVGVAILGASAIGAATTAFTANKAADVQSNAARTGADAIKYGAEQGAGAIREYGNKAIGAITDYGGRAIDTVTAGRDQATNLLGSRYEAIKDVMDPYSEAGQRALAELEGRLPYLTSPITMDQATLEQTPGYQFTQRQGLKAVQNSAAARGLGVSGAAQKGAAEFATGLANKTYQDQFALENTNRNNAFNRLMALVTGGADAAFKGGALGSDLTKSQAGVYSDAGKAIAGIQSNIGTGLGSVYGSVGTGQANAYNTIGTAQRDGAIGAANAQGGALMTTGNAVNKFLSEAPAAYAGYKGLYGGNKLGTPYDNSLDYDGGA